MPVELGSASAGTTNFVVGVGKKLWVGCELFQNCNSPFGTHDTVFGSKSADCTDGVALPDDDAVCSSTLSARG